MTPEESAEAARVREEVRVEANIGLDGRVSFMSSTEEVDVVNPSPSPS